MQTKLLKCIVSLKNTLTSQTNSQCNLPNIQYVSLKTGRLPIEYVSIVWNAPVCTNFQFLTEVMWNKIVLKNCKHLLMQLQNNVLVSEQVLKYLPLAWYISGF